MGGRVIVVAVETGHFHAPHDFGKGLMRKQATHNKGHVTKACARVVFNLLLLFRFYGCTPFYGESSVRIIANITRLQYSFPDPDDLPFSQHAADLIKDILVLSPRYAS